MTYWDNFETWVDKTIISWGVADYLAVYFRLLIFLLLLVLVCGFLFLITKKIIHYYVYGFFKKTDITWDDVLVENRVFDNVAHIVPSLLVLYAVPNIFSDFPKIVPFLIKLIDAYLILVGSTVLFALLKVAEYGLAANATFKDKPISSYFQLIRIIFYIVILILVLSIMLNKSPIYFLSAFGAMTAILLLIFKDTILGLVASVQMSANDMVRVGDWVEMHKFNADGEVLAINLNTVKVQNWDKTITNIPTYYFITDSFKNWRGMVQSGGRRIKRALYIDAHSVKFVDPDTREEYKKFYLLKDFVGQRQKEIEEYNKTHDFDPNILINGRRMTNIGVFRKYVELYLQRHPHIRKDMTIMVRQLAAESKGIPIEIYCFTNTTAWHEYENIQADVFDHLFSTTKFFDLEIFQEPSGRDFSGMLRK
jgi:miniconductance mechanosensitive channel